jgi:hypothetical protein
MARFHVATQGGRRWFAALALVLGWAGAAASETTVSPPGAPPASIRWYCWLDGTGAHVGCLLESAPVVVPTAGVNFAILRRLAPLVTDLRVNPHRVARRVVAIPLWSPPHGPDFVRLLARSVMCGSQRRCEVEFDDRPDERRVAALLREDMAQVGPEPPSPPRAPQ